jgi:hypothetical protein
MRPATHLTVVLVFLAACTAEGQAPRAASRMRDDQTALLRELRTRLDSLRQGVPREPVRRGGDLDVSPLRGLTRDQIRRALGTPEDCGPEVHDESGNPIVTHPCRAFGDWFYSFYRFPRGWRGGGPDLLLRFNAAGVCTTAEWRFSR